MGVHEGDAIVLQRRRRGAVRAQPLPLEDEVRDVADQFLDRQADGVETRRSSVPQ